MPATEYDCTPCSAPQVAADADLRELLTYRLKESQERYERAEYERETHSRVADACREALVQLNRNEPQQCSPSPSYR